MRVLRSSGYTCMPWKNGGGETIEMLVSPDGASFETFDWRISMARVAAPGPFSLFPGVDRTLSVIAGAGISLAFEDRTVTLDGLSEPVRFAGDAQVISALVSRAIEDLNVMTRRGRCDHRVKRHSLVRETVLKWQGDIGVVIAIDGSIDVQVGHETVTLASRDALLLEASDPRDFAATPHDNADVFVNEIWHATA